MTNREQQRIAKHDAHRHRNALDSLGRSNENKRGPKREPQLTEADMEWQRIKYNLKRANRQSAKAY